MSNTDDKPNIKDSEIKKEASDHKSEDGEKGNGE